MTRLEFSKACDEIRANLETPKAFCRKRHDEYIKKVLDMIKNIHSANLQEGCDIVRLSSINMGNSRYPDIHKNIETITVKKLCDKIIIGTYKERCNYKNIILVLEGSNNAY